MVLWGGPVFGDRLQNGSPYAMLSCPVCPSVTFYFVYCGQTVGWIKMKLGVQVGLGPGHIVLDGDPAPLPPKGHSVTAPILAHICYGQMAGWNQMPLRMEVGLCPGRIVLDGGPAPPPRERGTAPPSFRPMSIVATVAHLSYC